MNNIIEQLSRLEGIVKAMYKLDWLPEERAMPLLTALSCGKFCVGKLHALGADLSGYDEACGGRKEQAAKPEDPAAAPVRGREVPEDGAREGERSGKTPSMLDDRML